MSQAGFDIVMPLYRWRWNTQAVLEGLTTHYQPRAIHIITPGSEARSLREKVRHWQVAPVQVHEEEPFFEPHTGLTKDRICAELDLGKSLYTPGWFYQQLLKLGAPEGIEDLSEWYVVWDSDLLPVETWPLIQQKDAGIQHPFALLQHNQWGNSQIVSTWANWIRSVLGVEPLTDGEGTFIPHHMWFKQAHLQTLKQQIGAYYQSEDHWLLLMMRSANEFGTFGEYWIYSSWVAAKAPADLVFHPYNTYGETTERFFDDGTGLFSAALKRSECVDPVADEDFSPSYAAVLAFIRATYPPSPLPSSLSFESSPRHLKKDQKNMHIEEQRSRWNPRRAEATSVP
ncbi:MAG: hypothetical protein HC812_13345 [Leptolyngbya sp. RL_3_1]|nr:hypothetical protein [Leptolyngbya sp. RL_3_1]